MVLIEPGLNGFIAPTCYQTIRFCCLIVREYIVPDLASGRELFSLEAGRFFFQGTVIRGGQVLFVL